MTVFENKSSQLVQNQFDLNTPSPQTTHTIVIENIDIEIMNLFIMDKKVKNGDGSSTVKTVNDVSDAMIDGLINSNNQVD